MRVGRLTRVSDSSGVDLGPTDVRQRFQIALNRALVVGRAPDRAIGLGPHTVAAVTRVAAEHPDATAEIIAAAYDAFQGEHG